MGEESANVRFAKVFWVLLLVEENELTTPPHVCMLCPWAVPTTGNFVCELFK
jgi:hypothetical protein